MRRILFLLVFAVGVASSAHAFQLKPVIKNGDEVIAASDSEGWYRRMNDIGRWAANQYSYPVHETITNALYQCHAASCPKHLAPTGSAPEAVLAGVRWNDNPPFVLKDTSLKYCANLYIQLPVEPVCWAEIFKAGQRAASRRRRPVQYVYQPGKADQYAILLRSHFGDLQFLHAMASKPKERAGYTRDKILMWAEFTWRITVGEFERGTDMVEARLRMESRSPTMLDYFGRGETVQTIFFKGEPAFLSEYRDFAFGSLLHIVEDSYSRAHAGRASATGKKCEGTPYEAPGAIEKFYTYVGQDSNRHDSHDTQGAFDRHRLQEPSPNLVDVGKSLVEMKNNNEPWSKARPYFECLFRTLDPMAEADDGGI